MPRVRQPFYSHDSYYSFTVNVSLCLVCVLAMHKFVLAYLTGHVLVRPAA